MLLCLAFCTRPAISSTFKLVGTGPSEPLTGMGMPLVASDLHSHLMQAHRELKVRDLFYHYGQLSEFEARRPYSLVRQHNTNTASGCAVVTMHYIQHPYTGRCPWGGMSNTGGDSCATSRGVDVHCAALMEVCSSTHRSGYL
jgi:hypothetical protein